MKRRIFITSVALALNMSIFASNEKKNKENKKTPANSEVTSTMLSGNIIDQATGESLTGVKVILEGTNKVAYTDFDGDFSFSAVKPGKYKVKVDYISYDATNLQNVKVSAGSNSLKIELNTAPGLPTTNPNRFSLNSVYGGYFTNGSNHVAFCSMLL